MDKAYYKEYYLAERHHWFFKARNEIIMTHIHDVLKHRSSQGPLSILNVGVATGHTSELLKSLGAITSVEYDDDCFAFTKENVPGINLIQGSILELPFEDETFDLVCAFDVVEHVEDDRLAVSEMERVLKKGGAMVLTVPAFMSLWSPHDVINHHFRRYTKNQLLDLFSKQGRFHYDSYFNTILFPLVWLVRKINNAITKLRGVKPEDMKSDIQYKGESLLSTLLFRIFSIEKRWIQKKIKLPFGVSVITSWVKS